jgi:hypothetical protein
MTNSSPCLDAVNRLGDVAPDSSPVAIWTFSIESIRVIGIVACPCENEPLNSMTIASVT